MAQVEWFNVGKVEHEVQFCPAAHAAAEAFKEQVLYPHIHSQFIAEDSAGLFIEHMREQMDESRHYTPMDYERLRRVNAGLFGSAGGRQADGRQEEGEGRHGEEPTAARREDSGAPDADTAEVSEEADGVVAGDVPRPSRTPKKDLPGGLLVQICVHFGLRPGRRSCGMLQELREGFTQGDVEPNQPYEYYMQLLEQAHGAPPARPADEISLCEGLGERLLI